MDICREYSGRSQAFRWEKVSLITNSQEWDTSLEKVMGGSFENEDDDKDYTLPTALSYKDYLGMLLLFTDNKSKTFRMMDVVEMNMRYSYGQESFRIDNCMAAFEIQALVECSNGYCVLVKGFWIQIVFKQNI